MEKLSFGSLTIDAWSVGGIETCFRVPSLDLCLDIGRCPPRAEAMGTLLLTHAHIDHAGGLPYYTSLRRLLGMKPPRVYCPKAVRNDLFDVLTAWSKLDSDADRCDLIGVSPGDEIPLKSGHVARVFRSPHRVATHGYTVYSVKKQLRPDLVGLSGIEIATRAKAGEEVNIRTEQAELCFPGDTRIEVVDNEPSVRTARVLLLECTFCGPDVTVDHAKKSGHIHLDQIAERADLFENEHIVLTHWSRRFSPEHIRSEINRRLPATLRERVQPLLH